MARVCYNKYTEKTLSLVDNIMNFYLTCCIVIGLSLWFGALAMGTPVECPSPVIAPLDGGNLQLEVLPADRFVVTLASPAHNWFAGCFTNLPTSRPVVIGLSLVGNDTTGNRADVSKWQGLRPVISYADPAAYESYEWFEKMPDGHWRSGDPLKTGLARDAGDGPVPVQQAIPAPLATQFLTPDGRYWLPWREVDGAEALPNLNSFRMTQTFDAPTATLAMRIPFTYTYLQAFLGKLQAARLPGVSVDVIAHTREQRALQVIRVTDPTPTDATPTTMLLIAREHATEHAGSWALLGALQALLADTPQARALRKNTTWLFIPIEDPDGSAHATFDDLTEMFAISQEERAAHPEVTAYARYITDYIYSGHSIDIAVSLHNVEANEAMQVTSPFVNSRNAAFALDFNRRYFAALSAQGFRPADPSAPWNTGFVPFRLYGWCAEAFGTFDLAFEVNDRYPERRLALPQLQTIGAVLAQSLVSWTASPAGARMLARTRQLTELKRLEHLVYHYSAQQNDDD